MRFRVNRLGIVVVAALVLLAAGCGGSKEVPTTTATYAAFEKAPAAQAMAKVFSHASTGHVPQVVVAAVTRLARTVHVGTVIVKRGRLLLSNLGPKRRSIYAFPTTKSQVCFEITGLAVGCKPAFVFGAPASMDGGSLYFPSSSGPPAELAGITKDGVRHVKVVLKGRAHNAIYGHDAWYYRFANNRIPATAATKLLVTLADGSTKTIPIQITKPVTSPGS